MVTFTVAGWHGCVSTMSSAPTGGTVVSLWAVTGLASWVAFCVLSEAGVPVLSCVSSGTAVFTAWVTVLTNSGGLVLVVLTVGQTESSSVVGV